MRTRHVLSVMILAFAGLPFTSLAQPVGREVRVNTYTTGNQEAPSISSDGAGRFIFVWDGRGDGDERGIFGQRYDSNENQRLGPEFRVNTHTDAFQLHAAVSADPAGNFVVVWESSSQDGNGSGIFGQRFGSDGNPLGAEFQVNSYTTHHQRTPSVSSSRTGDFVVVWASYGQDGSGDGIFAQRYRSDGTPDGGEFQVNTFTPDAQDSVAVAAHEGGFVVVWESLGQDGNGEGIFGQRYLPDGSALGDEFQVNTKIGVDQESPAVAANESGFVVVWGRDGYYAVSVWGQRYDSQGGRVGGDFQVSRLTDGGLAYVYFATPQVAYDASGNFLVVWSYAHKDSHFTGSRVQARPYDAAGNPLAKQRLVNDRYIYRTDSNPRVAVSPDSDFVVAWGSAEEAYGAMPEIAARRIKGIP